MTDDSSHTDRNAKGESAKGEAHTELAFLNHEFLASRPARTLRILAEYMEPEQRFKEYDVRDTIVFFGSARILSREAAEQALKAAQESGDDLEGAELKLKMSRYYEDTRELAKRMTLWSKNLHAPGRRFVVCSGGGPGIMEAANRGAHEAGGKTIGLNIKLPFEQRPNPYITPALNFEFHYFFMRKLWFAYLAKALVVFPGGFGTIDEMFEVLTLVQTHKLAKNITVIVYGPDYWKKVFNFDWLIDTGAISPKDVDLFQFADTPEEAFRLLQQGLIANHLQPEADHRRPPMAASPEELLGPEFAKTR